jgi:cytochrome c oxidase cbb3-type subunit 3
MGGNRTILAIRSTSWFRGTGLNPYEGEAMRLPIAAGRLFLSVIALLLLTDCSLRLPGKPTEAERWRAPEDISDFNELYATNCAGCHGVGGKLGAARPLNDPLYLSFVPDEALRQVVSQGQPGTNMPAFSDKSGGVLTDRQIELLISGMRTSWSKPNEFQGVQIPNYSATMTPAEGAVFNHAPVNSSDLFNAGATAYQTYCARCHGQNGAGGSSGSIVDRNFLNLVSDQGLRTAVVVGRSDLGKPDWRSNLSGHPMTPQEIDAVVAWLSAQRQPSRNALAKIK